MVSDPRLPRGVLADFIVVSEPRLTHGVIAELIRNLLNAKVIFLAQEMADPCPP